MKFGKKYGLLIVVFVVILIALVSVNLEEPAEKGQTTENEHYQVIRIIDGDTLEVSQNGMIETIRLLGVDAPEYGRCYFEEARAALSALVAEKEITLQSDSLNENEDEYRRTLRYVYADEVLVNEALIRTGATRHLSFFPIEQNADFAEAERQAKENGLGLWSACY